MADKFLTNYLEDEMHYVVLDDEDDVYMKFRSPKEAIAFYDDMKEIYKHTNKKFFLTRVEHTVLLKDDI